MDLGVCDLIDADGGNDRFIVKEIDLEETERIDGRKEKVEREISWEKMRINLEERDFRKNIWGRMDDILIIALDFKNYNEVSKFMSRIRPV